MGIHDQKIQNMPFFKGFQGRDKALIDIPSFWKWLEDEDFIFMDEEDIKDREVAMDEHEKGQTIDLKTAVEEW